MKKRIEEDDVIYTIDKNSGDCIDIDVKPGVEEVSFNASFGREYLLTDCSAQINLAGSQKRTG